MTSLRARAGAFLRRGRGDAEISAPVVGRDDVAAALQELSRGQQALTALLTTTRAELASARNDIWASKAVRVGDRLLVGSRHENLVFLLEANDELIVPRFVVDGEYEPATTALLKRIVRHDSVCVDVGANFGYYACLMGHLAWNGRVLAYEADPRIFGLLAENVAINWCEGRVEPINAAVASEEGELMLHRWLKRSGNSGVIKPPDVFSPGITVESEPFAVRSVALDSLVSELDRVDVVKIDVEGSEALVIAGMSKFVTAFRPTVVLEWSPAQMALAGSTPAALASAIAEWDTEVWTLEADGTLAPIDLATLEGLPFQNVVLTPRSTAACDG